MGRRRARRRQQHPRGRPDAYARQARQQGYAARSVYKLEEIDRRIGLLRRGQRVVDLGAAPGSWSAYAAERVGPQGRVLAVDVQPIQTALPGHVHVRELDVYEVDPVDLETADVVLSDMAPATTGQKHADQQRSYELFERALAIAEAVLTAGGSFAGKIFDGPELSRARDDVRHRFESARIIRPRATRSESSEAFIAGIRRRA